nr:23S rRNA (pseudouridine(1915)-N(3))-methyltransferase RlmH [Liquorilactobacillus sicerae]
MIVVGKLKEKYLKQGIAEYTKRLVKFCKFKIIEVPDEKAPENLSLAQMEQVKETEGQRLLAKIKEKEYVFALAILGKERTSEEFANEVEQLTTYGHSDLTFVIGGSLGLSPAVLSRADTQISFGRFTLPHQLMRLVLTEQIYRAFMINNGSPYHK